MRKIRKVEEKDIPVLLSWYNWYILNGTETFEMEPLREEQFAARVHAIVKEYPYIVLEEDGMLCGYAYLDHFNGRAAYDWTADLSIYLNPEEKGKGYGSILMKEIMHLAKINGYRNIISIITETNTASLAFHEKFGFTKMAYFPSLGYKHGQWLGVSYYLKQLVRDEKEPEKLRNQYE